jgi:hypothetical protein
VRRVRRVAARLGRTKRYWLLPALLVLGLCAVLYLIAAGSGDEAFQYVLY